MILITRDFEVIIELSIARQIREASCPQKFRLDQSSQHLLRQPTQSRHHTVQQELHESVS